MVKLHLLFHLSSIEPFDIVIVPFRRKQIMIRSARYAHDPSQCSDGDLVGMQDTKNLRSVRPAAS